MLKSTKSTSILLSHSNNEPGIRFAEGKAVDHTFPCHIHQSFTLGIITSGSRIIHMDNLDVSLAANDCFIINPNQPHSCHMQGDTSHGYWIISIDQQTMRLVNKQISGNDDIPYFPCVQITDPVIIAEMTRLWVSKANNKDLCELDYSSIIERLISRFADKEPTKTISHSELLFIQQACDYINGNIEQIIRLQELSSMLHISPFYLNRTFRENIGLPPYAYLLQNRVKQSIDMLMETGSVTDVSYKLGFSDQSHFTRLFTKNVGISPRRFLELNKTGTR